MRYVSNGRHRQMGFYVARYRREDLETESMSSTMEENISCTLRFGVAGRRHAKRRSTESSLPRLIHEISRWDSQY